MPEFTTMPHAALANSPWYPYRARAAAIPWFRVQAQYSRLGGWQNVGTFYRAESGESDYAQACKIYHALLMTLHPSMRVRESRYSALSRTWAPWHEYPGHLGELVAQCPMTPHASQQVGGWIKNPRASGVGGWIKNPRYQSPYSYGYGWDWAYYPGI